MKIVKLSAFLPPSGDLDSVIGNSVNKSAAY